MTILSTIKTDSDAIHYFKELPFYNKPIEQLGVTKTDQAFSGYAVTYKVEKVERKDPIVQLKASKVSIKNLFSDLLNETKNFKYQMTINVLLKNTSLIKKLNLDRFILIEKQKQ